MTETDLCPQCGAHRTAGFCGTCGVLTRGQTGGRHAGEAPEGAPATTAATAGGAHADDLSVSEGSRTLLPPPSGSAAEQPPTTGHTPDRSTGVAEVGMAHIGQTSFVWPVPDRTVALGGRAMSLEVVVAAGIYGIAALWLTISLHDVISLVPDLISGLFGDGFEFFISWLVLLVLTLLAYIVVLLAYTCYALLRNDPVGRGLSTVITVTLFLLWFTDARTGTIVFLTLLSGACTAVLFLSPWARRALDGERRHGRPWPVVLSQTLTYTFFAFIGLLALAFTPGFRYTDLVGEKVVLFVLFALGASAAALYGSYLLTRSPNKTGRILVTGAWAAAIVAEAITSSGAGTVVAAAVACGAAAPLWLSASARSWFGEAPLNLTGPVS